MLQNKCVHNIQILLLTCQSLLEYNVLAIFAHSSSKATVPGYMFLPLILAFVEVTAGPAYILRSHIFLEGHIDWAMTANNLMFRDR